MARARQVPRSPSWVRIAGAMLFPALLTIMLALPASAAPAVTMGATTGPGGGSVDAKGSGFAANDSVMIVWDGRVILGDARVDAAGKFEIAFRIPADATPGKHEIRYIAYTLPAKPNCNSAYVAVTFTVKMGGPTATPQVGTAVPTFTPCGPGTATPTTTTTATPGTPTMTATATTPTSTATATATVPTTATATATGTSTTPTATATSSVTATKTNTPVFTSTSTATVKPAATATKVQFPGTGSGGSLGDGDGDAGYTTSLIAGIALLSIGVASAGFTIARRRVR
jgi:hypothetical protein